MNPNIELMPGHVLPDKDIKNVMPVLTRDLAHKTLRMLQIVLTV